MSTDSEPGPTLKQRLWDWARLDAIEDPFERRVAWPLVPYLIAVGLLAPLAVLLFTLKTQDLLGTMVLLAGPSLAGLSAFVGLMLLRVGLHRLAASLGTWSVVVGVIAQLVHYGHPDNQLFVVIFLIPITASAMLGRTAMALSQAAVAILTTGIVAALNPHSELLHVIAPPALAPEVIAWPTFALTALTVAVIVATITNELRHSLRSSLEQADAASVVRSELQAEVARNQHANRDLVERKEELEAITAMAELLLASRTPSEAQTIIEDLLGRLFTVGTCRLFAIEEGQARLKASSLPELGEETAFATDDCWAIRRGRIHQAGHGHSSVVCRHVGIRTERTESLCVPLAADGETRAIIWWQGDGIGEHDRIREHRRVSIVAEQLGLGLANLDLREKLRELALKDALTGLFNRRFFDETLELEVRKSLRDGTPLSLLIVDVDRFKKINDTYGHDAGDEALKTVGKALQRRLRESDIVCRLGGEEFGVVLRGAPLDIARERAECLRAEVQQATIQFDGRPIGPITVSIGAAAHGGPTVGRDALLRSADEALYEAKLTGRNRVVLADPMRSNAVRSH